MHRKVLGGLAACCLLGVVGLALAGQPDAVVVTYGDLDLNTHGGVTTMYARLESAAKSACAQDEEPWSDGGAASCVDSTVRQAVSRIGAPRLVMLYETRTGHLVVHTHR